MEKQDQERLHYEFVESYGTKVPDKVKKMVEELPYVEIDSYQSGGGICHIFLRMENGVILVANLTDFSIEVSFKKWASIDSYLSADEDGFGYEYNYPKYEERSFNTGFKLTEIKNTINSYGKN